MVQKGKQSFYSEGGATFSCVPQGTPTSLARSRPGEDGQPSGSARAECLAQPVKNMGGRQQYLCLSRVLVTLLYVEVALRCLARGPRL